MEVDKVFKNKKGVYKITCIPSKKIYVGSTCTTFSERLSGHKYLLRKNKSKCRKLQQAWIKYGEESFLFEVLEVVEKKEDILEKEQYWMDLLCAYKKGLNSCPVANLSLHSKETKRLMSKIAKEGFKSGRRMSFYKGKSLLDSTKFKLSVAALERHTQSHRVLTETQVLEIIELLKRKLPHKYISELYGVKKTTITKISTGRTWKYLNPDAPYSMYVTKQEPNLNLSRYAEVSKYSEKD